jgi:hypothetical protein
MKEIIIYIPERILRPWVSGALAADHGIGSSWVEYLEVLPCGRRS